MEREKKLTIGWLTIVVMLCLVILFLVNTLGDCKQSCEEYYAEKIQKECYDVPKWEVSDYAIENNLLDTKEPSTQIDR